MARQVIVDVYRDPRAPEEMCIARITGASPANVQDISAIVNSCAEWDRDGSAFLPTYVETGRHAISIRTGRFNFK